jgi:hypothetical protein
MASILGLACAGAEAPRKLSIGAVEEFGIINSGRYLDVKVKNDWVSHFGVALSQTAAPSEDLKFDIGLGGVFGYQKEEKYSAQWPDATQWKMFMIGPLVADMRWRSAADGSQGFGLQLGMFTYKYNRDAHNLGEYLFRSGAYPGYIISGDNVLLKDGAAQLQGVRAGYTAGSFNADFILTTETSLPAFYDLSPAVLVNYKTAGGLLEAGAGANFKHLIPMRPSFTSRQTATNSYFDKDGVTYAGDANHYYNEADFYKRKAAEAFAAGTGPDTAQGLAYTAQAQAKKQVGDNVFLWANKADSLGIPLKYYTQSGIILNVHAGLDLKTLFSSSGFGEEDLRVYAEAAMLGVANYPVYYDKPMERIPVMFGINLPAFHYLDLLCLQAEYYGSPWLNSYNSVFTSEATPELTSGQDAELSRNEYNDIGKRDNWSWSLLLKKKFAGAAWFSAQVAHDHMRVSSRNVWGGPGWVSNQVLTQPKDWYWTVQFGYGI